MSVIVFPEEIVRQIGGLNRKVCPQLWVDTIHIIVWHPDKTTREERQLAPTPHNWFTLIFSKTHCHIDTSSDVRHQLSGLA